MTKDKTLLLALIMKYLWQQGFDRKIVKKAVDSWWNIKEKNT
jgi:hypothetical protein